jgi:lipid-binding SYLF domain-containing protein
LRPDDDANEALYGRKIDTKTIVLGPSPTPPPAANQLIALLDKSSPTSRAHK